MLAPNPFRQSDRKYFPKRGLTWLLSLHWIALNTAFPLAAMASPLSQGMTVSQASCNTELTTQIDRLLQRPDLVSAHWGIIIQNTQSQDILYQHNAEKLFVPASNVKLLTTAAALLTLGADYQLKTPFYAQGQAPILEQLTVVAQGDPTLTSEHLQAIALQLKNQGIRSIKELVLVDKMASQERLRGTWEWEDVHYDYAPPINQAILNQNSVNLTLKASRFNHPPQVIWSDNLAGQQWEVMNQSQVVTNNPKGIQIRGNLGTNQLTITGELTNASEDTTGISIPDPSLYFLQTLQTLLTDQGIKVEKVAITNTFSQQEKQAKIAEISSPTLAEMITKTNQESNNVYAEALANLLKEQEPNSPEPIQLSLETLGLKGDSYLLKDGSGLSRQNLVSPRLFQQLLFQLASNQNYRNSLAVAGQSGTLKNRFLNTPLEGKLQGKTGTLSGVSSLSGYLTTTTGQPLVFSILVNSGNLIGAMLRPTMDQILLWAEQKPTCSVNAKVGLKLRK